MEKKEVFVDVSARHVHLSREDQDVLFCAMDHPDEILVRSLKAPFEIREAGFGRDEGAVLYSMGIHAFTELAKEAKAIYRIRRIVLVNTEKLDEYIELMYGDDPD